MDEFWRYIQTLVTRQDTESYLTCPVHDRSRRPAYDRQAASTSSNGFADGSYGRGHSVIVEAVDKDDGEVLVIRSVHARSTEVAFALQG